jgi:uncharacterized protein involved in exopolysaccharide biosynthesis
MLNSETPQSSHEDLQIIKGDEIDLVALVKTVWNGRKIIYISVAVCVLIGLIVAFTSTIKYTASATLLPSAEKKGGGLGGLSALAGMAGINIGAMMGDASGIASDLYPQVVNSVPFKLELMHQKLTWEDYSEPMSIYEKVNLKKDPTFGAVLAKYTYRLPWTIKNAITGTKEEGGISLPSDSSKVYNFSEEDLKALGALEKLIVVMPDKKSGLITVKVEMGEPLLAAQVTQKSIELLQAYIIDYKTSQVRQNLEFVQQRFAETKKEYERSQRAFFDYKDTHRNMVSERMDPQYQLLSDAYDISAAVYKGLAQQLEQAKITVKEETPVFTVLDPVVVPKHKSAPKRSMILAVSLFLGGFLGLVWIFGRLIWRNMRKASVE